MLSVFAAGSQSGNERLQQAADFYQKEDYARAVSIYEDLLKAGYASAGLHYNLGNAYFKTGDLGKAVLHYEKGLKLAPGDEDLRFNLKIAQGRQTDQIDALPPFFLLQWWMRLRNLMPANAWSLTGILMLWGCGAGLTVWQFGRSRTWRKRGFAAAFTLAPLALLFFALAFSRQSFEQHTHQAIVTVDKTELRIAPDPESKELRPLHAGAKSWLEDRIGDWYKVKLSNGEVGWLPVGVVEEI